VNQVVSDNSDYDSFRESLEMTMHPTVHNNVGGDFAQMYSPNDPLFFSHHAYIDYIWAQWQKYNGNDFGGATHDGSSASTSDSCQGLPYAVSDVMDCNKLCYSYGDLADNDIDVNLPAPNVPQPADGQKPDNTSVVPIPDNEDDRYSSKDRSNLNIVRYPDTCPDAWAAMNKYDVNKLRQHEANHRNIVKQCNEIEGYASPCCLWKRSKLCSAMVAKKAKFYCDVRDYGRINADYSDPDPYQACSNVHKRVEYCSNKVDLPADSYKNQLQKIVGKSAFDGAGSLSGKVDKMSSSGRRSLTKGTAQGVAMCLAAIVPFVVQSML